MAFRLQVGEGAPPILFDPAPALGAVLSISRNISTAQVIALRTVPVVLIPAVTNKVIVPIAVVARSSKPNDGLSWVVDQQLVIYYSTDPAGTIATKTNIFTGTVPQIAGGSAVARALVSVSANINGTFPDTSRGNPVGAAIMLANQTTTAQAGGATTSGSLRILYTVIDKEP